LAKSFLGLNNPNLVWSDKLVRRCRTSVALRPAATDPEPARESYHVPTGRWCGAPPGRGGKSAAVEEATKAATEAATEVVAEAATEAALEAATEADTEAATEAATKAAKELATERPQRRL
jgi:hypothetical protein